jgi:integrase
MVVMQSVEFPQQTFNEAFPLWIASRTRIAPATKHDYEKNFKRLTGFFGAMPLAKIHIGHIREYVESRKPTTGPSRINHEISTLQQMLKRAGLWGAIAAWYEPLALPRTGPGIALEVAEEEHLFAVARTRSRWRVAYYAALITANTTAGPEEIRMLQLKDINLTERVLHVRDGAKNKYRVRALPLNDDALWAVQQLVERAGTKGAVEPDHYLLPSREGNPLKPVDSWKKAWYSLRAEAGKKFPRLAKLRRYDLRHHSMTRLLENPDVSEQTIEDIAGHISHKMKQRYSHIRMQAKRDALTALSSRRATPYAPVANVEGFYPRGRKPQVRAVAAPCGLSGKSG